MRSNRLTILVILLVAPCVDSFAQQISHDELVEVLGIQSWRIPLPKDERMNWGIDIVDYEPRKYTKVVNAKLLDTGQKALIVLRDLEEEDYYQFSLKQRGGLSQGKFKIALCTDTEMKDVAKLCDGGYNIEWHSEPKPYDDGSRFVIADISHMLEPDKPRKQIVLVPKQSKFE